MPLRVPGRGLHDFEPLRKAPPAARASQRAGDQPLRTAVATANGIIKTARMASSGIGPRKRTKTENVRRPISPSPKPIRPAYPVRTVAAGQAARTGLLMCSMPTGLSCDRPRRDGGPSDKRTVPERPGWAQASVPWPVIFRTRPLCVEGKEFFKSQQRLSLTNMHKLEKPSRSTTKRGSCHACRSFREKRVQQHGIACPQKHR